MVAEPADVEKLDPVRRLIMERLVGIQRTLADASRYIQRNQSYMHQFIWRTTPKRLPEDVRGALAAFLGVSEDALRHPRPSPPPAPPLPGAHPPRGSALAERSARLDASLHPAPSADVPVFAERDVFDPRTAVEWIGRPPLLATVGPLLAVWMAADHGTRLRAGDLVFMRMHQPARVGDPVVVLAGHRLVCIGDLLEADAHTVRINLGKNDVRDITTEDHQVCKVACVVLP